MLIAVDYDNTIVEGEWPYDAVAGVPPLRPGALEGLRALKRAGHVILLWSARANRALLFSRWHDPLHRAGFQSVAPRHWKAALDVHWARWFQMLRHVDGELRGLIDAVDDGQQGKPCADLFLDDHTPAGPIDWNEIAHRFGA